MDLTGHSENCASNSSVQIELSAAGGCQKEGQGLTLITCLLCSGSPSRLSRFQNAIMQGCLMSALNPCKVGVDAIGIW